MARKLYIIPLLLLSLCSQAQYVRIAGSPSGTAFYLDLDHIWSYNLYETSRWGLGGQLAMHPSIFNHRNTTIDAYVGYGLRDMQWKGGIGTRLPINNYGTLTASVRRDYIKAASRSLSTYNITNITSLSSFMTSRLCDHWEVSVGYTYSHRWTLSAEGRAFIGHRLFSSNGLLYSVDGDMLPREDGALLRFTSADKKGLAAEILLGATWPEVKPIARLLAQYDKCFKKKVLTTKVFMQGGIATPGSSYTYLFDLGGTYSAPILFDHTLQTALPNEFTASVYVIAATRVATTKSLWDFDIPYVQIGSHPVPFIQMTVAWGDLWNQDATGQLFYEGLPLQAPHMGIAEPAAGVEGLLRWGVTDWGLAAAYRLTPPQAPYSRIDRVSNLTLLLTARLIL